MASERQRRWRRRLGRQVDSAPPAGLVGNDRAEAVWRIVKEIADPLVEASLAEVRWAEAEPGPWMDARPTTVFILEPANRASATVWAEPVEDAWVHLGVGDAFPDGSLAELDFADGWEDRLRACLHSVVAGEYREHVHPGDAREMIFERPDGSEDVLGGIRGSSERKSPGEYRYEPYRR